MANIYVRSTTGNNANNGSTWALAKATVAGAMAIAAAGDTIWVSQAHSESTASAVTWTSPGTIASPVKIFCGSDTAEPPTTLSTTAAVAVTGSNTLSINGHVWVYGINFNVSSGASIPLLQLCGSNGTHVQQYFSCYFNLLGTSTAGRLSIGRDGLTSGARVEWTNCQVGFASSSQGIQVTSTLFEWRNGVDGVTNTASIAATTSPTALFKYIGEFDASTTSRSAKVVCEGLDLSGYSAGMHLIGAITGASEARFDNCKRPTSWSGLLVGTSGYPEHGARAFARNFENSSGINYSHIDVTRWGTETTETTIVKTGGMTDGVTPASMKMATGTGCGPGSPWSSQDFEFEILPADVGVSKTITFDFVHDSTTNIKDDVMWAEVAGQGVASSPLGIVVTDRCGLITTPADQDSSAASWTTTGMTNPNAQKCVVTFTPQQAGIGRARLRCAIASKTFYYDAPVLS